MLTRKDRKIKKSRGKDRKQKHINCRFAKEKCRIIK